MINKDLGYYLCDNLEFSSKINALIHSKINSKPVEWIFHNELFKSFNWQIEPEETLDFLYDKRAKELREKYDYLVLSFSGGSDTNNILESFIRQRLHIDEIVTNHITDATKSVTVLDSSITKSWNFAAEHELQAVPRLNYIYNKLPKTKITVLDVSSIVLNSILEFDDVNWVLNKNDHLSIGQLFRYNYFYFSELKKKFDKNLKIGIIVGLDKPKTVIRDNKFYITFNDAVANITTINDFNEDYSNITVEMFYWSKDTLPMMAKQAHVIKNFLNKNKLLKKMWYETAVLDNKTYSYYELNRLIHEKILRSLIYTTWNRQWFQAEKSTFWWNTEFDLWFKKDKSLEKQQALWMNGIKYLQRTIPEYIVYKDGVPDALKKFSHSYYIGNIYDTNQIY